MSGFKSDAQRKHFFANHGEGSAGGAGVPSFSQPEFGANVDGPAAGGRNPMPASPGWTNGGAAVASFVQPGEFSTAQMDAIENDYADYWENSGDFVRNPGFKNSMPK